MYFALVFVSSTIWLQSYAYENGIQVNTTNGPVVGIVTSFAPEFLEHDGTVYEYLGVPYAKPPIGGRRFQPPEPMDPWDEVYNAIELAPLCPQVPTPFAIVQSQGLNTSEDCLRLNIYVPSKAFEQRNVPVMVWIHGGGYSNLGASLFDSVPLSSIGEVIVVNINYRLNMLGFLSTGDDEIPANLGLLDQQFALRWVQENIAAFGGNPDMVTIFGESAGAACVSFQLLSAESRPFFQRAILQSGTPLMSWVQPLSPESARDTVLAVAAAGDCLPDLPEDTAYIADCLRNKTVEELMELTDKQIHASLAEGLVAFGPVDDDEFFPGGYSTLLQGADFSDVDVIIGTNKDEGNYYVALSVTGDGLSRPFFSKEQFASFTATADNPLALGLLEAIYSNGIDDTGNYVDALTEVFGDIHFTCGSVDFAKLVSATGGGKTYIYRMTHEPLVSLSGATWVGANHGEDLPFVFGLPFSSETPVYDELKLSFYFIRMWTNFAKSGDPNLPVALPKSVPEWPEFSAETEFYKELDVLLPNNQRLQQHQCNFWNNVFPKILELQAAATSV